MLPNVDSVGMGTCDEETLKTSHTLMVVDKDIRGTRPRGRPCIRWMDNIRRDMKTYGIEARLPNDGIQEYDGNGRHAR